MCRPRAKGSRWGKEEKGRLGASYQPHSLATPTYAAGAAASPGADGASDEMDESGGDGVL